MLTLFVLGGSALGSSFKLKGGEHIGRTPECEVRLNDRSVSRKHALVERDGDRWVLSDLGSRNGVFVEGERVPEIELIDGTELTIGEIPIRIRMESSAASKAVAPVAKPTPAPAARSAPKPAVRRRPPPIEEAEEFVLEDELVLEDVLEETARTQVATERPEFETKLKGAEDRRREILSHGADGGGFLGGDLSQRPVWMQFVIGLAMLAFFVAIAAGAWWGVMTLRSG